MPQPACRRAITVIVFMIQVLTSTCADICDLEHAGCGRSNNKVPKEPSSIDLAPGLLHLRLLPDLDRPGHRYVLSLGDQVEFYISKCQDLQSHDQYQWQLTDQNVLASAQLCVSYQGEGDNVQLHDQAGSLLASVDLCRGAYYTVIKFSWNNKTYRWAMNRKEACRSPCQLQMSLFEGKSKEAIACFCGPGFQRKKFWVQQPEPDSLTLQQTDDRLWLQVVVATCIIAAKTQRHKDKVTDHCRRSGQGFL